MNDLTRDAQADDAKLRILAKLQNLFSNMSVGGFIAMPILILPIFFIDGLAETIFPVVAMFIIFGLIIIVRIDYSCHFQQKGIGHFLAFFHCPCDFYSEGVVRCLKVGPVFVYQARVFFSQQ